MAVGFFRRCPDVFGGDGAEREKKLRFAKAFGVSAEFCLGNGRQVAAATAPQTGHRRS